MTPARGKIFLQLTEFEIKSDPRLNVPAEAYQEQFAFLVQIRDKLTETHKAIKRIRDIRIQLESLKKRLGDAEDKKVLVEQATEIVKRMTEIEETLYQTKSRSGQDPLNFPIRLNNRLSALVGVVSSADGPPTQQTRVVYEMVVKEIDENLAQLQKLMDQDVDAFNNAVRAASVPAIFVNDD